MASATPSSSPPAADAALRAELLTALQRELQAGLDARAYPGAYAIVGNRRGILASYGVGHMDWPAAAPLSSAADASSPPPPPQPLPPVPPVPSGRTIWDVASLSKVVGTTTAALQLVERGVLDLDAPVSKYKPSWIGPGKAHVTVRQLLTHSSGLPAHKEFWKMHGVSTRDQALAAVAAQDLETIASESTPRKMVYSDLGIILLGDIIEQLAGMKLDAYLAENLFKRLGMVDSLYNPPPSLRERIAPTETCAWRSPGRLLRAVVHDENAFLLGGVAGHAGMFASGDDLARFAQAYLCGGALPDPSRDDGTVDERTRILTPSSIALACSLGGGASEADIVPGSNRALGWEKPSADNSAGAVMYASAAESAIGHTGFTGTSLWIDPATDVFVCILSNRVNPSREHGITRIGPVRTRTHDAIWSIMQRHAKEQKQ